MKYPNPTRYELCERISNISSEENPVVGGLFKTEQEAIEWGNEYGYYGDNYYVREWKP